MEILRLKEILSERNITGKNLADQVDVTPASISNIVQGNSFPKPELLLKIAKALEVDVRDLFHSTLQTPSERIYAFRDGDYVEIGQLNQKK